MQIEIFIHARYTLPVCKTECQKFNHFDIKSKHKREKIEYYN